MRRREERWGAGVETQKNVQGEIGEWGRVPFNETYAPSLSTIYDRAYGSLNFLKMGLDPSPPPLVVRVGEPVVEYRLSLRCSHSVSRDLVGVYGTGGACGDEVIVSSGARVLLERCSNAVFASGEF